jgi:hypothetical protein
MAIWARLVWVLILILLAPARLLLAIIPLYEMKTCRQDFEDGLRILRNLLEHRSG